MRGIAVRFKATSVVGSGYALCVLSDTFALFAVNAFDRKGTQSLRKDREENAAARHPRSR